MNSEPAFDIEAEIAKYQKEQRAAAEARATKQYFDDTEQENCAVSNLRKHLNHLLPRLVQVALGGFPIRFKRQESGHYSVFAELTFDGLTCAISQWGDDACLTCEACSGWRGLIHEKNPIQTLIAELAFLREWNEKRVRARELHLSITQEITDSITAAEQVLWQWPEGKVLRLWRWQWCMQFGESANEHHTWSTQRFLYSGVLNDVFGRVRNIEHALPVGEFHEFDCLESLPSEMKEDVKLSIPGICWIIAGEASGFSRDPNSCYTVTVGEQPVAWVRDLLAKQEVSTPAQS